MQPTIAVGADGVLRPTYALHLARHRVNLNTLYGQGIVLSLEPQRQCVACDAAISKGYGGGHCYDCFATLARCDLCYLSPDRCHHHLGTCREPEWGSEHCMQPHSVYLSVTSGPKVGITRRGREHRRWIDQGATAGLKIIDTSTRRAAGLVEAELRTHLNDRTDWKKMLTGRVQSYDLLQLAEQLQSRLRDFAHVLDALEGDELDGVADIAWNIDAPVTRIEYPVTQRSPGLRLSIPDNGGTLQDNLLGVQGGYLLFSTGVLAIGDYRGVHLSVVASEAFDKVSDTDQMPLF